MSQNLNFNSLTSHTRGLRLTGTLLASLVAVAVVALVTLWGVTVVFGSVFSGIGGEGDPADELKKLMAAHNAQAKTAQDRFNGRSIFFKPPPSFKPAPPPPPPTSQPVAAPPPPPITVTYAGPTPIYAIGDTVWFKPPRQDDPQLVLSVGDEEKHGVTVISTNLPWTVKLGWRGKEFDIDIFKRKAESFLIAKAPAMTLIPGLVSVPAPTVDLPVPNATGEVQLNKEREGEDPNMVDPEDKPGAPSPEQGNDEPGESPDDPADTNANQGRGGRGRPRVQPPPAEPAPAEPATEEPATEEPGSPEPVPQEPQPQPEPAPPPAPAPKS